MDEQAQMTIQQHLDQFGSLVRDMAPHIAAYFRGLTTHDIPEEYAIDRTRDFQNVWLARLLGPPGGRDADD